MFKEKYKEYNADITPNAELLERTLEKAHKKTTQRSWSSGRKISKISKIAAAAACTVLAACALTASVNAAMGGGIRQILGLKDSVIYDELNDTQTVYLNEEGQYVMQSGAPGSKESWTLTADSDSDHFIINFKIDNHTYSYTAEFAEYMTEEDVTWEIYSGLCRFFMENSLTEERAEILAKLQSCADSIENPYYKKGVELAIADMQSGKQYLIDWVPVVAEGDYSDPETDLIILGCAWIKIDPDTVPLSEDGTAYIETETVAGMSEIIGVTIMQGENGPAIVSMIILE